jgi:hypothetical protein
MMMLLRRNPLNCRVNEFDRKALMKRYVTFMQDMANVSPAMHAELKRLATVSDVVRKAKGHMKISPGLSTMCFLCM